MVLEFTSPMGKASTEDLRQIIDNAMDRSIRFLKQQNRNKSVKDHDLTGLILKRRKSAILASIPIISEKFQAKYPLLNIKQIFIDECASTAFPMQRTEKFYHLSLAMAIYILDTLEEYDQLENAMPYMDIPVEQLPELEVPFLYDPLYSIVMIRQLEYIIQCKDKVKSNLQCYINEEGAKRTEPTLFKLPDSNDPSDWSYRDRFNAIMSLIPQNVQTTAAEHFENTMWQFFDVLLSLVNSHMREEDDNRHKALELKEQFLDCHKAFSQSVSANIPLTENYIRDYTMQVINSNAVSLSEKEAKLNEMDSLRYQGKALEKKADELEQMYKCLVEVGHVLAFEDQTQKADYYAEDLRALWNVPVTDPFEICFGYLCLIENGSNLPWLYNLPTAVLMLAVRKLPWTVDIDRLGAYEKYRTNTGLTAVNTDENGIPDDDSTQTLYGSVVKDSENYDLVIPRSFCVQDADNQDEHDVRVNIAQIVYGLTGTLLPRQYDIYAGIHNDLIKEGMDPGLARGLELYLHLAHQAPLAQYDYEDADLSEEEQNAIIGKLEKKISQMENQLQRANAEISGLKKELHNTKKEADSSRIKLDMAMSEAAEQTQELADLRELIFRQANEHLEDQEQSEPTQIIFPYQVKRHYMVFGGHETWLKAIKPMLPNVTFIPKGQQPQASLIRNQDAIWIQANAISHADFYKIINVIRANHIPVYYFGFASAQKCATQLAEEDTKISG